MLPVVARLRRAAVEHFPLPRPPPWKIWELILNSSLTDTNTTLRETSCQKEKSSTDSSRKKSRICWRAPSEFREVKILPPNFGAEKKTTGTWGVGFRRIEICQQLPARDDDKKNSNFFFSNWVFFSWFSRSLHLGLTLHFEYSEYSTETREHTPNWKHSEQLFSHSAPKNVTKIENKMKERWLEESKRPWIHHGVLNTVTLHSLSDEHEKGNWNGKKEKPDSRLGWNGMWMLDGAKRPGGWNRMSRRGGWRQDDVGPPGTEPIRWGTPRTPLLTTALAEGTNTRLPPYLHFPFCIL